MGKFVKGDVVVIPFPFSNLSDSKRRPALVIAPLSGDDVILCSITSSSVDPHAVPLSVSDLVGGSLDHASYIRPTHLFTADSKMILRRVGNLPHVKTTQVIEKIIAVLKS